MVCKYSAYTWSVLLGMIVTGSARSIAVKIAYQSGLKAPLTITLVYLLGQSLSLFVYWVQKYFAFSFDYNALSAARDGETSGDETPETEGKDLELNAYKGVRIQFREGEDGKQSDSNSTICTDSTYSSSSSSILSSDSSLHSSMQSAFYKFYASARASFHDEIPNGSNHGLSTQSEERIRWVHQVPFYAKPVIPALFNLLNSALRWAALMYIDASVAEMMISGLELSLSVIAARIIRKRIVAKSRWMGVIIVTVGVIIIERANNSKHQKSVGEERYGDSKKMQDVMVGVLLILLQSVLSVFQDIAEEIFMQAADFPATMLLGLKGCIGFCLGLIVYVAVGEKLGIEDIDSTLSMLRANEKLRWWIVGLPLLFLITGIFNIKSTEVTSAMTRNVWKNLRTVFVWAIALSIFYLGNDTSYGEAWHMPESAFILLGFMVMTTGIIVYYWFKEKEQSQVFDENSQIT